MYDFWLGTPEEIAADEERFLIAVKRMTPRWINSIPDSEFIAVSRLLAEQGRASSEERPLVIVETGVGASTIACAYYAMKHRGLALSWDMNGAKGAVIRQVISETISNTFRRHVDDHWKLVAYNSLSPWLGLPILPDLVDHVDLFIGDSEHTWEVVGGELEAVIPMLRDGAVVALDDANQDYESLNEAYVNTFRRKLGLGPIPPVEGNRGESFHVRAERLLGERFEEVEHLADAYKEQVRDDPYFAYYGAEFDVKAELGTERLDALEHRFDSWRVARRRG